MCTVGYHWFSVSRSWCHLSNHVLYGWICCAYHVISDPLYYMIAYLCVSNIGPSGQEVWLFYSFSWGSVGSETYVLSVHSDFRMVPLKKVKNLEENLAPMDRFEGTAALWASCRQRYCHPGIHIKDSAAASATAKPQFVETAGQQSKEKPKVETGWQGWVFHGLSQKKDFATQKMNSLCIIQNSYSSCFDCHCGLCLTLQRYHQRTSSPWVTSGSRCRFSKSGMNTSWDIYHVPWQTSQSILHIWFPIQNWRNRIFAKNCYRSIISWTS